MIALWTCQVTQNKVSKLAEFLSGKYLRIVSDDSHQYFRQNLVLPWEAGRSVTCVL